MSKIIKKIFKWIKTPKNPKPIKILKRKKRMISFKKKNFNDIKIRYVDNYGNDLTKRVRSSYVYNGIPGGFYVN